MKKMSFRHTFSKESKNAQKITALGVEVRSLKSVFLMSAMLTTLAG
jgi:hypothetical protein